MTATQLRPVATWRWGAAPAAVAAVVAVMMLLGAGPAQAHNVLIASTPADGATLAKPPSAVTFTFDQPVQNFQPEVVVIDPEGQTHPSQNVTVDGNAVTGSITAAVKGPYTASYRIVSADGHPVTGSIHFTITTGTTPTAAPTGATAPPQNQSGGLAPWLWIGLGVAAVLIAVAVVLLLRRPTPTPPTEN